MTVYHQPNRIPLPERLFDCRRFVKPGDKVKYFVDAKDAGIFDAVADVIAVFEKFLIVQGKHITICVNRWDIQNVNGISVNGGCFLGHEELPR